MSEQICANCAHMSRKDNCQQPGKNGRRYGHCHMPLPWWAEDWDMNTDGLHRLVENIDTSGYDCECYKERNNE